ncbi:MAG: dephospho-CoA kinase [Thermoguttaceae bacterium]
MEAVGIMVMPVVGLLGGVASGKSLVARLLTEFGAGVLDADRAGHEALGLPKIEEAARKRWGEKVFGVDGHIDRKRLAEIVFAPPPEGPQERRILESWTHPEIAGILRARAETLAAESRPVAVLDAPLLLEAGWDKLCNTLVFVEVPRPVRLARALRRGWTSAEFEAREQAQLSVDVKRARADLAIENAGHMEETRRNVARLWPSLIGG